MKNNLQTKPRKNSLGLLSISAILCLSGLTTIYAAGPAPVNLLSASNFTILAKTGISTTGTTLITGDIGVSPNAATSITGFGLSLTASSPFATSPQVIGKIYAPNYANPTPSVMTTAINDMQTAYTDGAGRSGGAITELGAGNIGGLTLAPGLYKWGTGVTIPADVTLSGNANDIWIFQIAQNLNVSSAVKIVLAGGAQANNVFWIVAGQTTIGTTAIFNGNILDQTAIVLNTGAVLHGRALAQTAVTLDSNVVTSQSSNVSVVPVSVPIVPVDVAVIPGVSIIPTVITVQVATAPIVTPAPTQGLVTTSYSQSNPSVQNFGQEIRTVVANLTERTRGNDVKILQEFLMSQNKGDKARALSAVGATSYFGFLTRGALAEFQTRVGITPALGNFGGVTREYIRLHY